MNRRPAPALRVDVRERAVGELDSLLGAKRGHEPMFAKRQAVVRSHDGLAAARSPAHRMRAAGGNGGRLRARGLEHVRVELDEGRAAARLARVLGDRRDRRTDGRLRGRRAPRLDPEKRLPARGGRGGHVGMGHLPGAQLLAAALGARVTRATGPSGPAPRGADARSERRPGLRRSADGFHHASVARRHLDLPPAPRSSPARPRIPTRLCGSAAPTASSSTSRSRSSWRPRWGEVPAYAESLESTLGPGGLERLLAGVAEHAPAMVTLARELFGRWLELAAGSSTPHVFEPALERHPR